MFWLRDHSTKPEEDFQPPTASRVTVLAYSVRHAAFGGQFGGVSAMGELLYEEYLLPFLDIEVSEISTARSRFFGAGLEIPPVFDDPALWTDFDDGYPFLFGSITDRAGGQFSRLVIDAFESDGPEISTHGADVTWDPGVSVSEVDPKLAGVTGESDTKALAIAAPAESQISWTIAPELLSDIAASVSYVTVRLSVPSTANENCVAQVQEVPPIYMSLTDETSSSQLLLLNDYADLHPSDAFEVPNGCRDSAPLQSSVRIPLADFCAGSDLLLDELTQVTLTFEEYTEVVIDSLEFGGSPGAPSRADCKCL
jgi:hypothetical protein